MGEIKKAIKFIEKNHKMVADEVQKYSIMA
jgi:hypothetical protein